MIGQPALNETLNRALNGTAGRLFSIRTEADVMEVARGARQLAERLGFSQVHAYHLAIATSELATNLAVYAGGGTVRLRVLDDTEQTARIGIELSVEDQGPGIPDLALAMTEGYSTGARLGCGLPGASRLMDEFSIDSSTHQGTRIRAVKWRQPAPRLPAHASTASATAAPASTASAAIASAPTASAGTQSKRTAPGRQSSPRTDR
ncbi:MAG: anti-sigma regulatory factor [Lamprobacter sp.]|uniref:anti-sigma regulatory factor n=1 Tax=Lamprobacter sp. TaxID=3100796 RepID=UPI002B2572C1|nr:anti-sigma regulatory factor [Lamprobacter sp.]MEA3639247.1 anti-sigma regulatory factor [Lamprobacter sp.]